MKTFSVLSNSRKKCSSAEGQNLMKMNVATLQSLIRSEEPFHMFLGEISDGMVKIEVLNFITNSTKKM